MSFREKMDVIDLIISTLMKHEKKFDDLIDRLEISIEKIEMK